MYGANEAYVGPQGSPEDERMWLVEHILHLEDRHIQESAARTAGNSLLTVFAGDFMPHKNDALDVIECQLVLKVTLNLASGQHGATLKRNYDSRQRPAYILPPSRNVYQGVALDTAYTDSQFHYMLHRTSFTPTDSAAALEKILDNRHKDQ